MTLTPGDRVTVHAPCSPWLPWTCVGSLAEVVRANAEGVTVRLLSPVHADRALRYVPGAMALHCLALARKETP